MGGGRKVSMSEELTLIKEAEQAVTYGVQSTYADVEERYMQRAQALALVSIAKDLSTIAGVLIRSVGHYDEFKTSRMP